MWSSLAAGRSRCLAIGQLRRPAARISSRGAPFVPVISSTWRAAWCSSSSKPPIATVPARRPRRGTASRAGGRPRRTRHVAPATGARRAGWAAAGMVDTTASTCPAIGAASSRTISTVEPQRFSESDESLARSGERTSNLHPLGPQLGDCRQGRRRRGAAADDRDRVESLDPGGPERRDHPWYVGVVAAALARSAPITMVLTDCSSSARGFDAVAEPDDLPLERHRQRQPAPGLVQPGDEAGQVGLSRRRARCTASRARAPGRRPVQDR